MIFDPKRVSHWIRICVGLVETADSTATAKMTQFLRDHVDESVQEFELADVLLAMGLCHEAVFYTLRREMFKLEEIGDGSKELNK